MSSDRTKERVAMRRSPLKRTRVLLALVVVAAGMSMVGSTANAAAVSIDLCAKDGTATLVGATNVPIWGFGIPGTPGDCSTATAGLPGPLLSVHQGDTVTINVTNALPGTRTLTFEVPGLRLDAGPSSAASGATVTLTFTALDAGTYLYRSGGDSGRQQAMGLAGMLVVRPVASNPDQAYGPTTAYDVEAPLVLGAVDPAFNAAPDTFDMHAYNATYWLINGKAYPDTSKVVATAGQRVLLRYANAGYDNTSMLLLGMHERVWARDATLVPNPFDANAETIPAGGTEDAIATVPAGVAPVADGFALFNRQLHVTNGPQGGVSPAPAGGGGMLTFIDNTP
jgi:FtsP/CotA-like multicopper oxidase with cupredoxin domain